MRKLFVALFAPIFLLFTAAAVAPMAHASGTKTIRHISGVIESVSADRVYNEDRTHCNQPESPYGPVLCPALLRVPGPNERVQTMYSRDVYGNLTNWPVG